MPRPLEYHIHIDGQSPIAELHRSWFLSQGFWSDQFVRVPGAPGFEPHDHISFETGDRDSYEQTLRTVMSYLGEHPDSLTGYVESEAIVDRSTFPVRPFDSAVPLPIHLRIQPVAEILPHVPDDWFRQSEMHFSTRVDQTDPRLIQVLQEIGLYTAHYVSSIDPGALYIIFTVQGYQRDVQRLYPMIRDYLLAAGGSYNGSLQLEVVTASWKSSPDVPLPPIINPISFAHLDAPTA